MKRALGWTLGLVTHHFGWKLLSLCIAVMIWILVASEPELSTFANVPLEYKNLPSQVEISSSLVESIYVEVRGPSGELSSMNDVRRPAVVLDMADVRPGSRTFAIGDGNVRLPRGVRLMRAVPAQVRFDFEARSERQVPVRVRFASERQAAEVASYHITPANLRIVGPERHVAKIAAAITDPVDLSEVQEDGEIRINAFVEDAFVRFSGSPSVVVSVTMKKK